MNSSDPRWLLTLPVLPARAQTGRTNPHQTTQGRSFKTSSKGSNYIYSIYYLEKRHERVPQSSHRPPGCHLHTGLRCVRHSWPHTRQTRAKLQSTLFTSCLTSEPHDKDQFPSSGSNQQMWLNWSSICKKKPSSDPTHCMASYLINTPCTHLCSYSTFPSSSCLISHCI